MRPLQNKFPCKCDKDDAVKKVRAVRPAFKGSRLPSVITFCLFRGKYAECGVVVKYGEWGGDVTP